MSIPKRPGIARTILVAVIVVVLVLVGVGVIFGSGALNSSTSTSVITSLSSHLTTNFFSTTTSTSSTFSTPGLAIDDMENDVVGPGFSNLSSNMTTIDGTDIFLGNTSSSLVVVFDIVYTNCTTSCPTHVTGVNITSGFTITSTKPAFPIAPTDTPGSPSGQVEFLFDVNIVSPSTPFNGPLLLVATVQ